MERRLYRQCITESSRQVAYHIDVNVLNIRNSYPNISHRNSYPNISHGYHLFLSQKTIQSNHLCSLNPSTTSPVTSGPSRVHPWINCFWSHGFLTLHQTSSHHLLTDSDGSQKFGSPKSEMYSHKDIKNFSPVCWVLTFFFESQHTDMSFVVVESAKHNMSQA